MRDTKSTKIEFVAISLMALVHRPANLWDGRSGVVIAQGQRTIAVLTPAVRIRRDFLELPPATRLPLSMEPIVFDWFENELARVRTPKFHLLDGAASDELRQAVTSSDFPLPPSYKEFVLRYGNACLYRRSSYWLIDVYAGPREAEGKDGRRLIQFGKTWTSLAYFDESKLLAGHESPVFEWYHQAGLRKTAEGFEEWLIAKCKAARKRFKKMEWDEIEMGPAPFTEHELQIVHARKLFRWQVVGITPSESLRFEVHNGSTMILPYLSLGVSGSLRPPNEGPLNGGVFLPVAAIRPGETATLEIDCYKKFIAPQTAEVFELPDPGPEDREQYWEFRSAPDSTMASPSSK